LRAGRRIADSHGDPGNIVNGVGGVRRLMPVECERLQGFPDGWSSDIVSDSQAYKQMGNAVTVPVAEWIGRRMMGVEKDARLLAMKTELEEWAH